MKLGAFFTLIFTLFFSVLSTANQKADSLLDKLKGNLNDTSRSKTLRLLAAEFAKKDYKQSILYAYEALKYAEISEQKSQIGYSYRLLGKLYFDTGNYDSALVNFDKSILNLDEKKDPKTCSLILTSIGTIYFYENNYNKSLENFLHVLQIAERVKSYKDMGTALGNLGNIYKEQGKYDEALSYYKKGLKCIEQAKDVKHLGTSYINIGNVYYELAKAKKNNAFYDSSLVTYYKAEKLVLQYSDSAYLGMLYANIGNIYADRLDYKQAFVFFNKAIKIREAFEDFSQMGVIYTNLATCYIDTKQWAEAEKNLKLALTYAKENNSYDELADIYKTYSQMYSEQKKFEKAYEYYMLYKQYGDSVLNDEGIEKRKELEMNFTFEKEREKQQLEEDKKDVIRAEEKKRGAIYIAISIGGIILSVFIALIIFRNYKRSQRAHAIISKQKNEIEKQKHFVEEKNKEVMDSIHYAKRIQRALLTSENYFKKYVNDFFILYKPKDIVSGDFYWALNLNNKFYLATADCTGHGVPGAFMSLLNISFLNEVIIEKKITRPDLILDEIRNDIIKALNPEGIEKAKDGMDCSLCCFDFEKMELTVAAANNPVWILRNNILMEIKPDKMPVGMYADEVKPFSLEIFKIEKGDIIYTFTDGYADQFGGPKGKKFKYRQLEEKLIANCNKPMAEQKEILSDTFDKWKEGLEQIDDVLLIAVKV
ncbi:MAG TPA: tetratricopeptide repeat protein [Bacteroidia bacterium]|nr:tetratricopeptide repeat protein [Bacteroidia bacterium]